MTEPNKQGGKENFIGENMREFSAHHSAEMISTEIWQCRVAPFGRLWRAGCRRGIETNNNTDAGEEADRSAGSLQPPVCA